MRRLMVAICLGGLALTPGLVTSGTVHAAGLTFAVNGVTGTDPASGCQSSPFKTIGAALSCVNGDATTPANPDTITIAAGTYDEHGLSVAADVSIEGKPGRTIIDGQSLGRVLFIDPNSIVTLSGLTITHGSAAMAGGSGGGIFNGLATLTITNSTIRDNTGCIRIGCLGSGGGIYNVAATLTIANSTISGNIACSGNVCSGGGGGIVSGGFNGIAGNVSITNTVFTGNVGCSGMNCFGDGGGIYNEGALALTNSVFTHNAGCSASPCTGRGGGMRNDSNTSTVTLTNDTIRTNAAFPAGGSGDGGGIYNGSGTPTLQNDTITSNTPDNCAGIVC
jgi:hypothetical protein